MVSKPTDHELILPMTYAKDGVDGFIVVHRFGARGVSLGATRLKTYNSRREALKDALSLSRLMSYKASLADLPYGGAKGVIISSKESKEKILVSYAHKLNSLNGKFVTGTDIGLDMKDLKFLKEKTKFVVGFKNNPEEATAKGVFYSMEVCLKKVFGSDEMSNRTVTIQGLGKVGLSLLNILHKQGAIIYAADPNPEKLKYIHKKFPKVKLLSPEEIIRQKTDIFSPCALGDVLDKTAIKKLRSEMIVGGANNQLASADIGEGLHKAGVLYAPDYAVNSGGLMAIVDELENKNTDKRRLNYKLRKIGNTLKEILEVSGEKNLAPNLVADELAQKKLSKICG